MPDLPTKPTAEDLADLGEVINTLSPIVLRPVIAGFALAGLLAQPDDKGASWPRDVEAEISAARSANGDEHAPVRRHYARLAVAYTDDLLAALAK